MRRLNLAIGVTLVLVTAIACTLLTPTTASPSLGTTRTRPADGMVMVYVPAGEFQMGSTDEELDDALAWCNESYGDCVRGWFTLEQPAHAVAMDGFWIDRTEVTNAQYAECVASGACDPPFRSVSSSRDSYYGDSAYDDYPVIYVDWHQADAYCAWVGGRLPTEAEWEYAARGPEGRVYPWGNNAPDCTLLNYWSETGACVGDTAAVGSYPNGASWRGVLDMSGNVAEFVADWYGEYPSGRQVNPTGPTSGYGRVLRGGSWGYLRGSARSAYRGMGGTSDFRGSDIIGFRCAGLPGE